MTDYLVDSILKRNLVNTIVGPSGSGKTKWYTQMFRAMHERRPFLGFGVQPLPRTHYVALDRPQVELDESIVRAKLENIPEFTWESLRYQLRKITSLQHLLEMVPDDIEHLVIDGIGFLVKDIIKQREVGLVFADFDNWLMAKPRTASLIHHTAKAKDGFGYLNPREKSMGSGAWAQCSGIYVDIAPVNSVDITDSRRNVAIMSNNREGLSLAISINKDGILEPDPDIAEFTREELQELTGDEDRTLSRHIDQWIKQGLFQRMQNGKFRGRLPR